MKEYSIQQYKGHLKQNVVTLISTQNEFNKLLRHENPQGFLDLIKNKLDYIIRRNIPNYENLMDRMIMNSKNLQELLQNNAEYGTRLSHDLFTAIGDRLDIIDGHYSDKRTLEEKLKSANEEYSKVLEELKTKSWGDEGYRELRKKELELRYTSNVDQHDLTIKNDSIAYRTGEQEWLNNHNEFVLGIAKLRESTTTKLSEYISTVETIKDSLIWVRENQGGLILEQSYMSMNQIMGSIVSDIDQKLGLNLPSPEKLLSISGGGFYLSK